MKFELPDLPFAYNDLEPFIDAFTVEVHYDRHHRAYTSKFNEALDKEPAYAEGKSAEDILGNLDAIPASIKTAVINNGGGYYNHNLYWSILGKNKGGKPEGKLAEAINETFGSFEAFKEKMSSAAATLFGSGWAFLVVNKDKKLEIVQYTNQSTPISFGLKPILTIDVWEHAYYLKYQNKRPNYIEQIWNIINWKKVAELYEAAIK